MATGKKSGSGGNTDFGPTYMPGDKIPTPVAVEKNTDSAWALWSDVSAAQDAKFANTTPESRTMPLGGEDPRYAKTRPMALTPDGKPRAAAATEAVTVDDVMLEARRNNRVCPRPDRWQELFDRLPDKLADRPMPPMIGPAWNVTSSLSKRTCVREHIEWAASHDFLEQVFAFLKQLPESEWYHMGD